MSDAHRSPGSARSDARRFAVDRGFLLLCLVVTSIACLLLAVLIGSILLRGLGTLDWAFVTGGMSTRPEDAGFAIPILGSVWLLVVCAATALPLGVGTAVFLEEYRPKRGWLRSLHGLAQTNIRNLAGVP